MISWVTYEGDTWDFICKLEVWFQWISTILWQPITKAWEVHMNSEINKFVEMCLKITSYYNSNSKNGLQIYAWKFRYTFISDFSYIDLCIR